MAALKAVDRHHGCNEGCPMKALLIMIAVVLTMMRMTLVSTDEHDIIMTMKTRPCLQNMTVVMAAVYA